MSIESDDLIEGRWSEIEALAGGRDWLDAQARATGALERSRKVKDGSQLLRLALGYATATRSLRLAASWGAPVVLATDFSDVALMKRLQASGDFLAAVMTRLLSQIEGAASPIGWEGPPIRLVDGSLFTGPGADGGQHRLHASYDPGRKFFSMLDLSPVKKGESLLHAGIEAGDVAVADRNFAKTPQLRALDEKRAFYLVRTGLHGVRVLEAASGKRLTSDLVLAALGQQKDAELDVILEETKIAKARKPAPLAARLIITRASPAVQSREEARIHRSRSRYGVEPSQETKDLAGLVLFLTNLPAPEWPIAKVCALYRLRWQIELAFKTLKSTFHMRDVPAKEPRLARTWILANLVAVLLSHLLANALEQATPPSGA
jgi:hypothetical protein